MSVPKVEILPNTQGRQSKPDAEKDVLHVLTLRVAQKDGAAVAPGDSQLARTLRACQAQFGLKMRQVALDLITAALRKYGLASGADAAWLDQAGKETAKVTAPPK